MRGTKIIDRTDEVHPVLQGHRAAGQCPAVACQRRQTLPEGRVESLDVGGVNDPIPLRATPERLDAAGAPSTMRRSTSTTRRCS